MNQGNILNFADPPERHTLEPFATTFLNIVIPEAIRGNWFESGETPTPDELERISRRIAAKIEAEFAHPIHPAIWVHALLVCAHFFYPLTAEFDDPQEEEHQMSVIDAAYSLAERLKLHHDLYELYLRIS